MTGDVNLKTSYDCLATEYVRRIYEELQHKPFDREKLAQLAANIRKDKTICDMGCGPGHVARFLHECGANVCGVDLSPGMTEQARLLNPQIQFQTGNMLALNVPDHSWAGIAAFYSIIHIQRADLTRAFRELRRVLEPGGLLLVAFHIGAETLHFDELWGQKVCMDFHHYAPSDIAAPMREAGFEVEKIEERDPYPNVEYPSRRAYICARNSPAS